MDLIKQTLRNLLLLLISFSCITSCYEPIEGCLDPLSSNFQFDGDSNCDDCCEYPNVNISFNHLWEDENIDTSKFYLNAERLSIRIRSIRFLVSQIFMDNPESQSLRASDSIMITCDDSYVLYNSLHNISLSNRSAQLSNVALEEGLSDIQFNLGLSDCIANVDTTDVQNALTEADELLSNAVEDQLYATHDFVLEFDTMDSIHKEVILFNSDGLRTIQLEEVFTITRGTNLSVQIDVNYARWFDDLTLEDSDIEIKQKIIENSFQAFSLSIN